MRKIIIPLLFLLLFAGCQPVTDDTTLNLSGPVVFYLEKVTEPYVAIYGRQFDGEPVLLAGGIQDTNGSSYRSKLSPDKSRIILNLKDRLVDLPLETRQQKEVLKADYAVYDFIFSADGKRAIVWDQQVSESPDGPFTVHMIDLVKGESNVVLKGESNGSIFLPLSLRDDDILLLIENRGQEVFPRMLKIGDEAITPLPTAEQSSTFYGFSDYGTYLLVPDQTTENICNPVIPTVPTHYTIVDVLTGEAIGEFGDTESGKMVAPLAFSPDDQEMMFASIPPAKDLEQCEAQISADAYFRIKIGDEGEPEAVADFQAVVNEWYPDRAHFVSQPIDESSTGLFYKGESFEIFNAQKFFIDAVNYS